MYTAAVVIAQRAGRGIDLLEPAVLWAIGNPCFHCGEVNSAIEITRQKKVCARQACAMETEVGSRSITVRPPKTPCATTVPSAATASQRTPFLFSVSQVQQARITVRNPTNDATR